MKQQWTGRHWLTGKMVTVTSEHGLITDLQEGIGESDDWIGPGLLDLQVNGMGGWDLNENGTTPETVRKVLDILHSCGVTRFCPTVVTGSSKRMLNSLKSIAEACKNETLVDYSVIGIHVEGPFISPEEGPRGAHDKEAVRDPDWEEYLAWQKIAQGKIRKVTLAPERPGAIDFIKKLRANGIIVAIGHSAATEEDVQRAIQAGTTMSTHLGNGAHPYIKRHPNYIWAQLASDELWAGLIADGFHLPPSTLKVMIRTKGRKAILVSDASNLAGLSPGRYTDNHNGEVILEESGLLHLEHTSDILAGSAITLNIDVQNIVNFGISTLGEAINMASLHPAELFDIAGTGIGTLRIGGPADLMVYKWEQGDREGKLTILETVACGQTVFRK
ncbi:MAG: N-acetylglucosamine-6-phosphate deacetylase [Desulfitobacteriaceae bacterium]